MNTVASPAVDIGMMTSVTTRHDGVVELDGGGGGVRELV